MLKGFLMTRIVLVPGSALGPSTDGTWHSYWSNSTCASCTLAWSEVRPHFAQNHSFVTGFQRMFRCFIADRSICNQDGHPNLSAQRPSERTELSYSNLWVYVRYQTAVLGIRENRGKHNRPRRNSSHGRGSKPMLDKRPVQSGLAALIVIEVVT